MTNKEKFTEACIIRAQIIWWQARSAILPLSLIQDTAKNDAQFSELVEEREKILNDAWISAHNLHVMAQEYSERNDDEATINACQEVRTIGEDICTKIEEFTDKILAIRDMQ